MKRYPERIEAFDALRLEKYEPVPLTGCWLWTGCWDKRGYGKFKVDNVAAGKAHRFFYEKLAGPIPPGMLVCHKCDTPPCVNQEHLFLGTDADNMRDKMRKGRHDCRGDRNGRAIGKRRRLAMLAAREVQS